MLRTPDFGKLIVLSEFLPYYKEMDFTARGEFMLINLVALNFLS